ncbi:TSUP family transporter [Sphingomonas sp. MMS24-JH45]
MIVTLVFIAAFLAFIVSAVAGGGAGLVLVPLLRLILPVASIPGALSIGTAASSLSRIWLFRSCIRWDVVRRFVPTALPAAALGAWLLTRFEAVYVEFLLGCFLLLNLPALFRRTPSSETETPLSLGRLPLLGAAAGLLSGFTGAVGVVFNRAYYRMGLTKDEIVATRATNEVLLHLLKIALYAAFGLLPRSALIAGALVASAAVLASLASRRVLSLMQESLFRRAGLFAMVVSGVAMFSLSGGQIMAIHRAWVAYVAPGDERRSSSTGAASAAPRSSARKTDGWSWNVSSRRPDCRLPSARSCRPSPRAGNRHDRGGPRRRTLLRNLSATRRCRPEDRGNAARDTATPRAGVLRGPIAAWLTLREPSFDRLPPQRHFHRCTVAPLSYIPLGKVLSLMPTAAVFAPSSPAALTDFASKARRRQLSVASPSRSSRLTGAFTARACRLSVASPSPTRRLPAPSRRLRRGTAPAPPHPQHSPSRAARRTPPSAPVDPRVRRAP